MARALAVLPRTTNHGLFSVEMITAIFAFGWSAANADKSVEAIASSAIARPGFENLVFMSVLFLVFTAPVSLRTASRRRAFAHVRRSFAADTFAFDAAWRPTRSGTGTFPGRAGPSSPPPAPTTRAPR